MAAGGRSRRSRRGDSSSSPGLVGVGLGVASFGGGSVEGGPSFSGSGSGSSGGGGGGDVVLGGSETSGGLSTGRKRFLQLLLSEGISLACSSGRLEELYSEVHAANDCGGSLEECVRGVNEKIRGVGVEVKGVVMRDVKGGEDGDEGNEIHYVLSNTRSDPVAKLHACSGGTVTTQAPGPIYLKRILMHLLTGEAQKKGRGKGVRGEGGWNDLLNLARPVEFKKGLKLKGNSSSKEKGKDNDNDSDAKVDITLDSDDEAKADEKKASATGGEKDPTFTMAAAEKMLEGFVREKWLVPASGGGGNGNDEWEEESDEDEDEGVGQKRKRKRRPDGSGGAVDGRGKLCVGPRIYSELGSALESMVTDYNNAIAAKIVEVREEKGLSDEGKDEDDDEVDGEILKLMKRVIAYENPQILLN